MNSPADPYQSLFDSLGELTEMEKAEIREYQDDRATKIMLDPRFVLEERIADIEAVRKRQVEEIERHAASSVADSTNPEEAAHWGSEFAKLLAHANKQFDEEIALATSRWNQQFGKKE